MNALAVRIGRPMSDRRSSTPRRYLMCAPRFFEVTYRINAWMYPGSPIDCKLALAQWDRLHSILGDLGHRVELIEPCAGLPDMVFAANGAVVVGDRAMASHMAAPERSGEEQHYQHWLTAHGVRHLHVARYPSEGEGDFVLVDGGFLAGSGFRTTQLAHREMAHAFGMPVTTLQLSDPRWYHLDMALFALDGQNIAYYPGAFTLASRRLLKTRYPDAVIATDADALAFGLNSLSDGRHVLIPKRAVHLARQIAGRGYDPIAVDVSELHHAGGSVKCCILELHAPLTP